MPSNSGCSDLSCAFWVLCKPRAISIFVTLFTALVMAAYNVYSVAVLIKVALLTQTKHVYLGLSLLTP